MKKQILLSILAFMPVLAYADESGLCGTNVKWYFSETTQTLTISGSGAMTNYEYNYDSPWHNRSDIKNIIIEFGVMSIGSNAFHKCRSLTSISIPSSVTSIGVAAFEGCSNLTSVVIPDGVTSISHNAFYNCSGLTSVTIPNSVTSIELRAFSGCYNLNSVTIPNRVTSIGSNAFQGCNSLTTVTIPNSVTNIGSEAFADCSCLTSITIPSSVTIIGADAFKNTDWENNLPDGLVYAGKVLYKYKGTMPSSTFISIKDGTQGIAGSAFHGCSGLTSIKIPSSVTNIGNGSFYGCSGLTSIKIPSSVMSISLSAFSGCSGLNSITLPNSLTYIWDGAFYGCSQLASIMIPNDVIAIKPNAFQACTTLKSIIVPNSVTTINKYAFEGCNSLTSIIIGCSVKYIDKLAFAYCPKLTDVICLAEDVPLTEDDGFDIFYNSNIENAVLHVPSNAVETYKSKMPWSRFNSIVAVEKSDIPETPKCATPTIFYSDGKISFSCETEGVDFLSTISAVDAKSYYDSEIAVADKYTITVYATKAGYDNSDVVTRDIFIDDGKAMMVGDVNGDGEVNVADHVELSKIILNQE